MKMTKLTQIPYFYCMFTLNCFTLNQDSLPKIKDQDSNEVEYIPLCKSYPASSPLMNNVNSYSMICEDGTEEDRKKASSFRQIHGDKISLNTVVLKKMKLTTIENFPKSYYNFETLVLEDCFNEFSPRTESTMREFLGGVNFKNFVAFDKSLIHPRIFIFAERVHIDNSHLYTIFNDKSFENSFKTSSFTNLRHLTITNIRNKNLVIQGPFFPDSPLEYVDLSNNGIEDFEDFYQLDRKPTIHDKLIELYLNDNKLTFIPENLLVLFPKLEIFHIYNNPIFVLSSYSIKQLYQLQECLIFGATKSGLFILYLFA